MRNLRRGPPDTRLLVKNQYSNLLAKAALNASFSEVTVDDSLQQIRDNTNKLLRILCVVWVTAAVLLHFNPKVTPK